MEIVVKGRHCEVSDRFRSHVEEKITRLEKFNQRVIRVDVEVSQESNPRLASQSVRVEITIRSKGPVIRAEAASEDKMSALDKAFERLSAQARKAQDRRRVHHGVAHAHLARPGVATGRRLAPQQAERRPARSTRSGPITVLGDGPLVVREKIAPRVADDARPGALRDGAGRPRLLTCSSTRRTSSRRSSTGARATTTASSGSTG